MTVSRSAKAVLTVGLVGVLIPLAACSPSVGCGTGAESATGAVDALVAAATAQDAIAACVVLHQDSTSEQVEQETLHYAEILAGSTEVSSQVVDQMARYYTMELTVDGTAHELHVRSEHVGRWFWGRDVYLVEPVTYQLPVPAANPSPSSTP